MAQAEDGAGPWERHGNQAHDPGETDRSAVALIGESRDGLR